MDKSLKFNQYGSENGKIVIYFHGVPGAPEECAIFDSYAKENGLTIICFERFSVDASVVGEAYYQALVTEILKIANGKKIDVIGFSIGAFVALKTCRLLKNNVTNLHLVSAAAPLEMGDFLTNMAGKHVFKVAKNFPLFFTLLSYWQKLTMIFFPSVLFRLLFANASGKDKTLASNPEFQLSIMKMLKSTFIHHLKGYIRDISDYVQPWGNTLSELTVKTHIWHGKEDNWSPKLMAEYFKFAMPSCSHIEVMDGLSHYSCLYESAPKICNKLNKV
ncbi:MAG: alpha/beta hydrolase [Methylotenera sp.]